MSSAPVMRKDLFRKFAARSILTATSFAVGLGVALSPRAASANVIGSDFQSFNPISDGIDFVTVQSARTVPTGYIVVGGFFDNAHNTLPPATDANGNKRDIGDNVASTDGHFGLGLSERWDFGVNVAAVGQASTTDPAVGNFFVKQGLSDFRVATKYRFYNLPHGGWAVSLTGGLPEIQNDPFYGGAFGPTYAVELIGTQLFGATIMGVNFGYRGRNPGAALAGSPYPPVGSEYVASLAAAYRFSQSNWSVIGEFFSARPVKDSGNQSPGDLTNLEFLAGAKYWGWKQLALHLGATAGVSHGTSSPDWRVYAGLNWYPARLWGGKKPAPEPTPVATPQAAPAPEPTPEATPEATPPPAPVVEEKSPEPVYMEENDTSALEKESNQKREKLVVGNVHFMSGSAAVPPTFRAYLTKMAAYLLRGRKLSQVTIVGHTDSQGGAAMNQNLSEARAASVKKFLVEQGGLQSEKINTSGRGEMEPIATNDTPEGRERNRRVEFQVERE